MPSPELIKARALIDHDKHREIMKAAGLQRTETGDWVAIPETEVAQGSPSVLWRGQMFPGTAHVVHARGHGRQKSRRAAVEPPQEGTNA